MTLAKFLSEIFETEIQAVIDKEKVEKDFLKQEDFYCCRDRAEEGVSLAMQKVIDTLGLAIAVHREKEHGDDTMAEQATLLQAGAEPEVATRAWWND